MTMTLGIDVAVRAAHQASLAVEGKLVWTGRKFSTRPADLDKLWAALAPTEPSELTVVVEPTRNAWIVLASWFRARGAKVVMVPTTQSADLRAYYSKHAKNDRLDSAMLARLPLLHPEGLREFTGAGPADPLRRLVKQRSSIVKRRTAVLLRIDALLDLLGPAWHDVLAGHYGKAALMLLARYGDPNALLRLGPTRLSRFLIRHSRGAWREGHAQRLLAAARESLQLWQGSDIDFAELGADIAVEAEQARALSEQIEDLDERIAKPVCRGRPGRHRRLRARRGARPVGDHRRPPRRPAPVRLVGRHPLLLRTRAQAQPVRQQQPDPGHHQSRRPAAARSPVRRGRPGAPV
jgi:transposase